MTEAELARIETLLSEATPPPWRFDEDCEIFPEVNGELLIEKEVGCIVSDRCVTDASLICDLRNSAPSLISDLRSARKLIPPVDHVEALRNQVLNLIDDLRSYARNWDWKYGETWNRERAEIADVFEERIRLLSGEPAAQPPPDSSAALLEARRLLRSIEWNGEAGHWEESGCPECRNPPSNGHATLCALGIFLRERSDREQSEPTE